MVIERKSASTGFVLAREWLYLNCFFWVGVVVATISCWVYVSDRYAMREFSEMASILYPIFTTVPYLMFVYVRSILAAWRVAQGTQAPPEIAAEDIQNLLAQLPVVDKDQN